MKRYMFCVTIEILSTDTSKGLEKTKKKNGTEAWKMYLVLVGGSIGSRNSAATFGV